MTNAKTLQNVFSKYTPKNDTQRRILSSSYSVRTRVDRENRYIEVTAQMGEYVPSRILFSMCEDIKEAYQVNFVRIKPQFKSEWFSEKVMDSIFLEASFRGAITRGFFNEYRTEITADSISVTISTTNGGIDLIYLSNAHEIISDIIFEQYGLRYRISIFRDDQIDFDSLYEQQQQRWLAEQREIAKQAIASAEAASVPVQTKNKDELLDEYKNKITTLYEDEPLNSQNGDVFSIGKMSFKTSDGDVIYGESFSVESPVPLRSIKNEYKSICLLGEIFEIETRETRNKTKIIVSFYITDNDSAITCKLVLSAEEKDNPICSVKAGTAVAMTGAVRIDKFDGELAFTPKNIMKIKKIGRKDNSEEKRVELHLHTQMSSLDATIPPDEAVKTAAAWGHKAVAITDHGNVQGFPEAMLAADKINKGKQEGEEPFKVIYGMEGYFIDDSSSVIYGEASGDLMGNFVVFDIETTGLSAIDCGIIEIGAVKISNGEVTDKFNTFVNPGMKIPQNITELTGIDDSMINDAPDVKTAVSQFLDFCQNDILIAHNATFDIGFITRAAKVHELVFKNKYIDTVALSRYVNPELKRHTLDRVATHMGLGKFNHHRACDDAEMLALIFIKMVEKLRKEGINTVGELDEAVSSSSTQLKGRPNHIVLLVKNNVGLKNLYKIVSQSNLKYFYRKPLIPKTLLDEFREGLIVGSACSSGELYAKILDGRSDEDIRQTASYYDYLEIQPLCNNGYLVRNEKLKNEQAIIDINKRIIELGRELNIPVCATCDAHFLNKEDEIARKIIFAGKKMKDGDSDIGVYFRTTEEMLAEFSYLSEEEAKEIVITNPNKIADMIGYVRPIPKGNYPPKIEGADQELTDMCYNKMKSMYGDPPPQIVQKRLERELTSIISNGFGVLYIIAQKLVKNSEEKGYLVGSRGSVGSSFVATMANITEVNPLPPHYLCQNCKHSEFIEDGSVSSGFDLPDKNCPICGTKMRGDGHDIPFETFLGFYGDKSPDIDLNFSGDVQADAHKYTEVLFGEENVFRAGTIGTLASKTAYGLYVMKYIEEYGLNVTKAEIQHLVSKCVGVKRTTGQHPGGIIVVPREYDVYDFTPVQHPADDPKSTIVTTHFAFEYLHDTILKLDILGHDVPTKYKMLEKYTNTSVLDVPMNDEKVLGLLLSTEPLGITEEDIGSPVGTFGLPELGTKFVRQMLVDTKPKNFSDLLQISGLSHGTDVWLGNAQELIKNGTCTISDVIGTRDDIMVYLLHKGLDPSMAFNIMEIVRKGNRPPKILKEEHFNAMREHGVPEWYIESCLKIKYMFPKAHAAAYIISALRLGWYKIYYPLEFYAAYFTVAPGGFDSQAAIKGKAALKELISEIDKKTDRSQKDEEQYSACQLALEAVCRGVKFLPVSLQHSDSHAFLPENGKIRLPFSSLPGLGDTAAVKIAEACSGRKIYSIEELSQKAKISKAVIEILQQNGVLDGLSETNQISMFSFID